MRGFISTTVEPLIYGTRGLLIVRFAHLVFPFDYLLELNVFYFHSPGAVKSLGK